MWCTPWAGGRCSHGSAAQGAVSRKRLLLPAEPRARKGESGHKGSFPFPSRSLQEWFITVLHVSGCARGSMSCPQPLPPHSEVILISSRPPQGWTCLSSTALLRTSLIHLPCKHRASGTKRTQTPDSAVTKGVMEALTQSRIWSIFFGSPLDAVSKGVLGF